MATKKRFFKKKASVGNKSVKIREKITTKPVIRDSIKNLGPKTSKIPTVKREFPNILRLFTERVTVMKGRVAHNHLSQPKTWVLIGLLLVALSIAIWQAVYVTRNVARYVFVLQERAVLTAEMKLWEDIAKKYPNYRDANFQIAVLAYRLGDREKESEYLVKTLQIDPNDISAQQLEKLSK